MGMGNGIEQEVSIDMQSMRQTDINPESMR